MSDSASSSSCSRSQDKSKVIVELEVLLQELEIMKKSFAVLEKRISAIAHDILDVNVDNEDDDHEDDDDNRGETKDDASYSEQIEFEKRVISIKSCNPSSVLNLNQGTKIIICAPSHYGKNVLFKHIMNNFDDTLIVTGTPQSLIPNSKLEVFTPVIATQLSVESIQQHAPWLESIRLKTTRHLVVLDEMHRFNNLLLTKLLNFANANLRTIIVTCQHSTQLPSWFITKADCVFLGGQVLSKSHLNLFRPTNSPFTLDEIMKLSNRVNKNYLYTVIRKGMKEIKDQIMWSKADY